MTNTEKVKELVKKTITSAKGTSYENDVRQSVIGLLTFKLGLDKTSAQYLVNQY